MLFDTCHNAIHNFIANGQKLFIIATAGIALYSNKIRHHIGGHTTGDNAAAGSGSLVNATLTLHLGQGLGRNHHRVDAFFRLQATMGLFAVHADFILVLTGGTHHDFAGCALPV